MKHDHALRLLLAWGFFLLGLTVLGSAFVPANLGLKNALLLLGCAALALSLVLDRSKVFASFAERAPSGPVQKLRSFFAFAAMAAVLPALLGLALFFEQQPIGHGSSAFPGSILALFSLHPLVCAYLTLAGSGRGARGLRRAGP